MLTFVCLDMGIDAEGFVNAGFEEAQTLLDADVAIIDPANILEDLPEKQLFGVPGPVFFQQVGALVWRRLMAKRRQEVERLLNQGKVVIGMLAPLRSLNVAPDVLNDREAGPLTNYDWVPDPVHELLTTALQEGAGQEVQLLNHQHPFAPYYAAYRGELCCRAYLSTEDSSGGLFLVNKAGWGVGACWHLSKGWMVLLPYPPDSTDRRKLAGVLVQCARPLLNVEVEEEAPEWAAMWQLPGESCIARRVGELEEQVTELQRQIEQLRTERLSIARFRKLLYGKGHPLQDIVVESLRVLGFEADTVQIGGVDRDVVMDCVDGRAVAEVEGKDEGSIDIVKMN